MAKVIVMPKLGYTQDEGTIIEWHKKVGDTIANGEPFFDAQTDKCVITVDATCSGTLLKIALEPNNTVPVLTPIAVIGEPGEDADALLAQSVTAHAADVDDAGGIVESTPVSDGPVVESAAGQVKMTPRAKKYIAENGIDPASVSGISGSGFEGGITERDVKASPLARKIAQAEGVDLRGVTGTGIQGRIMKDDVLKAAAGSGSEDLMQIAAAVPYKGIRKIIGDKLSQSKFTAPHLYFTDAVDTTELTAFRKKLNEGSHIKIAVSDLLTMAACKALKKFPGLNVTLRDGQIITYKSINVGTAVAGDNGLIVLVIKNV